MILPTKRWSPVMVGSSVSCVHYKQTSCAFDANLHKFYEALLETFTVFHRTALIWTPCRWQHMIVNLCYIAVVFQIMTPPCLKMGSTLQSIISSEIYSLDTTVSYTTTENEMSEYVDRFVWSWPVCTGGERFPDMPALHYREAYETAIMYQHLSLWDALSFTEGVCFM